MTHAARRLRLLVIESETPDARARRRESVGRSEGESFARTLERLVPDADIAVEAPGDADTPTWTPDDFARFDGVFVGGSPIHVYEDTPDTRRHIAYMRAVFASGTPAFGTCAGLQLAVAAAGGRVRQMPERKEVGVARRITATKEGRDHPLLAGRGPAWDSLAIHFDEVEELPANAMLLAQNGRSDIQAAEIRCGPGIFWGVQYHPELTPHEIGAALRRQADSLVEEGLVSSRAVIERQATLFDRLEDNPDSREVRWLLGIDEEVACRDNREREIRNFIDHLVRPAKMPGQHAGMAAAD